MVRVQVNDVPVDMEFDTGAAFSLLNIGTFDKIAARSQLEKASVELKTYTGEAVPIMGSFTAMVQYGEISGRWGGRRDWLTTFEITSDLWFHLK